MYYACCKLFMCIYIHTHMLTSTLYRLYTHPKTIDTRGYATVCLHIHICMSVYTSYTTQGTCLLHTTTCRIMPKPSSHVPGFAALRLPHSWDLLGFGIFLGCMQSPGSITQLPGCMQSTLHLNCFLLVLSFTVLVVVLYQQFIVPIQSPLYFLHEGYVLYMGSQFYTCYIQEPKTGTTLETMQVLQGSGVSVSGFQLNKRFFFARMLRLILSGEFCMGF